MTKLIGSSFRKLFSAQQRLISSPGLQIAIQRRTTAARPDRGRGTADQADIFQDTCTGDPTQQWFPDAEGRLRNGADGRCLALPDKQRLQDAELRMATCAAGWHLRWEVTKRVWGG